MQNNRSRLRDPEYLVYPLKFLKINSTPSGLDYLVYSPSVSDYLVYHPNRAGENWLPLLSLNGTFNLQVQKREYSRFYIITNPLFTSSIFYI